MSEWQRHSGLMVECPGCGFTFGAEHADADADAKLGVEGTYSCPVCFESSRTEDDYFVRCLRWLMLERLRYQQTKWDYAEQDIEHVKEGLTEDAWMWQRGVKNYVQRIRLAQLSGVARWWDQPVAVQALMKLIATLLSMPEHLLRAGVLAGLPEPGHPSGEIREWVR